jgi:hypothetical protein
MPDPRLTAALDRIDQLNREDPASDLWEGAPQPREWVYSQRLTNWVLRLRPNASDALRIAARGQHIRRWTIPRGQYPRNRAGYLKWRETLKRFHADEVASVMRQAGYADAEIARVRALILKQGLGADPETQALEDALCLIFLETQFHQLRGKTAPATMAQVLRKTWAKMSDQAKAIAHSLPMEPEDRRTLEAAAGSA